jgi:RNA ligase partner protein
MHQFVLDTNFFINLQRPLKLGGNKEEVLREFSKLALPLIKEKRLVLYTTPDSYKELSSFFTEQPQQLAQLSNLLTITSPNSNELKVSAHLFSELIAETGKRLYRGLRVAEELVKESQTSLPQEGRENPLVSTLRDKYRRATREGFIDSTTDLGLIFLSYEKQASLVTSDGGLISWARNFGCQEILPEAFVDKIKALS